MSTRCDVCDIDLDPGERFCPGCGTPAPRRVADVSTVLRERYHSAASDDIEAEYAFGSARVTRSRPAPPRPGAKLPERDRERAVDRTDEEPSPAASLLPEVEVVSEVEVVTESSTDPGEDISPQTAAEAPVVLDPDTDAELEPEPEPQAATAPVAPQVPLVPVPAQPPPPVPAPRPAPAPVQASPAAEAAPAAASAAAAPAEFKPYVVLPRRHLVAVPEPAAEPEVAQEVSPEDEAGAEPRRGRGRIVVLLGALVIVAGVLAFAFIGRQSTPAAGPFTASSTDGVISLDAPSGWRVEAREAGVLGVGEAAHDLHVHATAIRRSALGDGLSLQRRAAQVHAEFLETIGGSGDGVPTAMKVGANPAIAQEFGTASVRYVHAVVRSGKYFVNVLAWTSAQRFEEARDDLTRVVGSLRTSG